MAGVLPATAEGLVGCSGPWRTSHAMGVVSAGRGWVTGINWVQGFGARRQSQVRGFQSHSPLWLHILLLWGEGVFLLPQLQGGGTRVPSLLPALQA